MHIQVSLCFHFYLLYLLLSSCDGNHATSATWSNASLTHGQSYHTMSLTKLFITEESRYVQLWRRRTSLWTSDKRKPALFRATNIIPRKKTRYVSRHFRRSYLTANKASKTEGTRKVGCAYHFQKCADTVYRKLSKLVRACRNYSLPKLAHFLWDTV